MSRVRILLGGFFLFIASGCGTIPPQPTTVTIMAFNVENLFDNVDDPDKNDRDYLPIAAKQNAEHKAACMAVEVEIWRNRCLTIDWTDEILTRKLQVVANTILQVNSGRGPDIIALQEIENANILERLRSEFLAAADYLPGVLIESWDSRGIDVAFLTRLPVVGSPQLHEIEFTAEFFDKRGDTRGILQTDFQLPDGSILTGFSVHFPAPFHPTEMRIAAYNKLNELSASLPDGRAIFAAGDFNTTSVENAQHNMLDRFVRPDWVVSNDHCVDCTGTAYYARDNTWSFLDMVLWQPACGAHATWDLRKNAVRIVNSNDDQRLPNGTPRRFSLPEGSGVSDHWPVLLTLEMK